MILKTITIRKYKPEDYSIWNTFVAKAKNATFLFHRDFMEYHSNRFEDFSLLFFDEKNQIQAVFPANKLDQEVYSHQGLTYGGLVFAQKNKAADTEQLLLVLIDYLKKQSIKKCVIKLIPSIYSQASTQDLDYFLYQKGAVLSRRDMNLALNLRGALPISKSKMKHYKRVSQMGLSIVQETDFGNFWNHVLIPRLLEKHQTYPVHTLEEIQYLQTKFPNWIKQFSVFENDQIIAGITIFESEQVVKSQYGATTKRGEQTRALDFLFIHLLQWYQNQGVAFFDMGIVTEHNGTSYNPGLLNQKEELGCSVFTHDFYTLQL